MGEENFLGEAATQVSSLITDLGTQAMPVVLGGVALGLAFFGVQFIVKRGKKAVSA